MNIDGIDNGFNHGIQLRLPGLLLLILYAVIFIVVDSLSVVRHFVGGSKFRRNLTVRGIQFE